MFNFMLGVLVDVSLIGGVILFFMSFSKKYKSRQTTLLIAGMVLVILGLIFLDSSALYDSFQKGYEASGTALTLFTN